MNFYSLEAADLSWKAELLPATKVSVCLTCRRERCFRGWLTVIGEGAVLFEALEQVVFYRKRVQKVDNWELQGASEGPCSAMTFLLSFFFFFPPFLRL